jgi:hypothetical protein
MDPGVLNERGPALNVFGIPKNRDWAPAGEAFKENASGAGARTRWVTERIA